MDGERKRLDLMFNSKTPSEIMQFFSYAHLPEDKRHVSQFCAELAETMDEILPPCAEKSAGLRKLLEAKDAFVRAKIIQDETTKRLGGV